MRQTGWLMPNAFFGKLFPKDTRKIISRCNIPEDLGFLIFPNTKSVHMAPAVLSIHTTRRTFHCTPHTEAGHGRGFLKLILS